jgi:hypothetical protein
MPSGPDPAQATRERCWRAATFFTGFDVEFYEETKRTADWGGSESLIVRVLTRKMS